MVVMKTDIVIKRLMHFTMNNFYHSKLNLVWH